MMMVPLLQRPFPATQGLGPFKAARWLLQRISKRSIHNRHCKSAAVPTNAEVTKRCTATREGGGDGEPFVAKHCHSPIITGKQTNSGCCISEHHHQYIDYIPGLELAVKGLAFMVEDERHCISLISRIGNAALPYIHNTAGLPMNTLAACPFEHCLGNRAAA